MTDQGYNGYTNWESFEFSSWWTNDEGMYRDFLEKGAGWLSTSPHEDSTELGRVIVTYARENYTGTGEGARGAAFKSLETDAEWDAVDLEEVGEEIKTTLKDEGYDV